MPKKTRFLFPFIFFISSLFIHGQGMSYPQINSLDSHNHLFIQHQEEVMENSKRRKTGKPQKLNLYSYKAQKNDTIFSISARLCINYDTIATINHIERVDTNITGKILLIPTAQGLFIPEKLTNSLEFLGSGSQKSSVPVNVKIGGENFLFYDNDKLSPSERAFFLNPQLLFPLEDFVVSSAFGMRKAPFSGKEKFHHGIDLAAPYGTKVMASRTGIVKLTAADDPVYGNYIILEHSDKTITKYAHLSHILVSQNQKVFAGEKIGTVGSTGLSTGPHLHFEVIISGESKNPENYWN